MHTLTCTIERLAALAIAIEKQRHNSETSLIWEYSSSIRKDEAAEDKRHARRLARIAQLRDQAHQLETQQPIS